MYETSSSTPHLGLAADRRPCIPARSETTSSGRASAVTTSTSMSLLSSKSPIASEPERYMPRNPVPRMDRTSDRSVRSKALTSGYGVGCRERAATGTILRCEYDLPVPSIALSGEPPSNRVESQATDDPTLVREAPGSTLLLG